jgi:hypothetical protein
MRKIAQTRFVIYLAQQLAGEGNIIQKVHVKRAIELCRYVICY